MYFHRHECRGNLMNLSKFDFIISCILASICIGGISSTDQIHINSACKFPKFRPDMRDHYILNWNGSDPGPNGCKITFEHHGFTVCFKKRTFYIQSSGIYLRYHANDSEGVDHSRTYTVGDNHADEFCGRDDNQVIVELYAIEDPGNPGHRIDTSSSYFSLSVSGQPVDFELIIALVAIVPLLLLLPVAIVWMYRNKERICERLGLAPRTSLTDQQTELTDIRPRPVVTQPDPITYDTPRRANRIRRLLDLPDARMAMPRVPRPDIEQDPTIDMQSVSRQTEWSTSPRTGAWFTSPRSGALSTSPRTGGWAPSPRSGDWMPSPRSGAWISSPRSGEGPPSPRSGTWTSNQTGSSFHDY